MAAAAALAGSYAERIARLFPSKKPSVRVEPAIVAMERKWNKEHAGMVTYGDNGVAIDLVTMARVPTRSFEIDAAAGLIGVAIPAGHVKWHTQIAAAVKRRNGDASDDCFALSSIKRIQTMSGIGIGQLVADDWCSCCGYRGWCFSVQFPGDIKPVHRVCEPCVINFRLDEHIRRLREEKKAIPALPGKVARASDVAMSSVTRLTIVLAVVLAVTAVDAQRIRQPPNGIYPDGTLVKGRHTPADEALQDQITQINRNAGSRIHPLMLRVTALEKALDGNSTALQFNASDLRDWMEALAGRVNALEAKPKPERPWIIHWDVIFMWTWGTFKIWLCMKLGVRFLHAVKGRPTDSPAGWMYFFLLLCAIQMITMAPQPVTAQEYSGSNSRLLIADADLSIWQNCQ